MSRVLVPPDRADEARRLLDEQRRRSPVPADEEETETGVE
jgi:hypothetical protein